MKPPDFWTPADGKADLRGKLLSPLGWIYNYFTQRRIKTAQPLDVGIPVICIGNATLGGTGKTPVAIYLLRSLQRLGIGAVGLTRGYGGTEKGPIVVHPKHSAADIGDEPLLLARHAPVWVSAAREAIRLCRDWPARKVF